MVVPIQKNNSMKGLEFLIHEMQLTESNTVKATTIKKKQSTSVSRLSWLEQRHEYNSVIVKHLPWVSVPLSSNCDTEHALNYETVAYKFLSLFRQEFHSFPKLIKYFPGIIVLEDLGNEEPDFAGEVETQQAVLNTLASMHAATAGKFDLYKDAFKGIGIHPPGEENIIPYHRHQFRLEQGLQLLINLSNLIDYKPKKWVNEIRESSKVMTSPDPIFHCFLHNDFISLRQSVFAKGRLHLIDFEHSKFGHALVDVFNLFIGKIEYNRNKRAWFRKHYTPVENILEYYVRSFETQSKRQYSKGFWEYQFASIAASLSVSMLGLLWKMPAVIKESNMKLHASKSIWIEIQMLLKTCCHFIRRHQDYTNVLEYFEVLQERLATLIPLLESRYSLTYPDRSKTTE